MGSRRKGPSTLLGASATHILTTVSQRFLGGSSIWSRNTTIQGSSTTTTSRPLGFTGHAHREDGVQVHYYTGSQAGGKHTSILLGATVRCNTSSRPLGPYLGRRGPERVDGDSAGHHFKCQMLHTQCHTPLTNGHGLPEILGGLKYLVQVHYYC